MRTHPNVVLQLNLTPHDLTRRTMRAIAESCGETTDGDTSFEIGGFSYASIVMEDEYDEGYQLSAKEGDIVIHDYATYGYGENIKWDELAARKESLEAWARDVCARFKCDYEIVIAANYW